MKKCYIIVNWMELYDENDIIEVDIPDGYDAASLVERVEDRMRELYHDVDISEAYENALNGFGLSWRYVKNLLGTAYIA